MQLFGSLTSPFVRHCRIALAEGPGKWEMVIADYDYSAAHSPSKKVPFFRDDETFLSDSSAILAEIRRRQQRPFLESARDWEIYTTATTCLDAAINIFLFERHGVKVHDVAYLGRQADRVASTLDYLVRLGVGFSEQPSDAQLRVACLLDWARFRQRFDVSDWPQLAQILHDANQYDRFKNTAPPAA